MAMAKTTKTYLFCFDDHRSFSEEVKKRFSDTTRYIVLSFQTSDDIITRLKEESENKFCKVAILGSHDSKENYEMIDHLSVEIKNIDKRTSIIILAPPEKIDDVRKSIRFNIDSYIPRNTNTILRIHNTVKKLMSEYSLIDFRNKRNFSFYILLAFLFISILFAIIAYFKLPMFF
jgi:DNA-binding NarL/FixJ family response regulator